MEQNTTICFVSWNTNGIKEKISDVEKKLLEIDADVAFLQETHIGPNDWTKLQNVTGWKSYFTVYKSQSKGVAILIRDKEAFEYICHDEDPCGGYIVLFCHLYGQLFTLANVYNHQCDRDVLRRLADYLKETAEGMLVAGGDFNTVLNPWIDRNSLAKNVEHSPLRNYLEKFITSLNLKDTWSYLSPTLKGFTRCQNDSKSRLDMFFVSNDMMYTVKSCNTFSNEVNNKTISDHYPLVLKLNVSLQNDKKTPNVALMLELIEGGETANRRPEKISGAEILSVIKSMAESNLPRLDELKPDYYKQHCCPITEFLKVTYNRILETKCIPNDFKTYNRLEDQYIFNVEYLILSSILAKRLSVFITTSFKQNSNSKRDTLVTVTLMKKTQKIKWSFLDRSLSNLKQNKPDYPQDFSILKSLLCEINESPAELIHLKTGCPLSNTILNLALKQLEFQITEISNSCVCFHRQALSINIDKSMNETINNKVEKFRVESGLEISTLHEFLCEE